MKNQPEDIKFSSTDLNGFFRGVVESNNDSLKMGRVQVRIFGLHTSSKTKTNYEGIPTADLPWAEPVFGLIEGSISGFGLWSVPLKGSHVMIFFENGNYTQPRYFGTVPGIPTVAPNVSEGFNDPDGVYPSTIGESDFHRTARGTKQTVTSPSFAAQYPHNIVLATHGGHVIEVDNTPGAERINIHHSSGSYIEINVDGNITVIALGDMTLTSGGDVAMTASGDITLTGTNIHLNP